MYRQVVRKEADARSIAVDPVVRLYFVEVEEPQLASPRSDLARLLEALEREWELARSLRRSSRLAISPACSTSRAAPGASRSPCTTASVVTAVWPGFHDAAYGIAFDVGSTTVAGHLCDLHTGDVLASAGEMNPQIRFGEDLMSRVSYVMLNAGSREGAHARRARLPREADRRAVPRRRRSSGRTSSR